MSGWLGRLGPFLTGFARHLQATRLLSGIAIVGLAVGFVAALMMLLIARNDLGYNGFVPDHDRIYLGVSSLSGPGMAPMYDETANARTVDIVRVNIPEVEAATRLTLKDADLRRGGRTSKEKVFWADANAFAVLRLPAVAGALDDALARPDGLAMTRGEAIRLFGRADALGQTIDVDGKPMVLRAVLADLPTNMTDLESGIFVSGVGLVVPPDPPNGFSVGARTYLRLRPGAGAAAVEARIAPLIKSLLPLAIRDAYRLKLLRIDRIALFEGMHPLARQRLLIGSLVAGFILFIGAANFVNLSLALSQRRWREIAVRQTCGAARWQIAAQFLGEAMLTVGLSALIGAAALELLLPSLNALMATQVSFDYVAQPVLLLWLLGGAALMGLVAGAYPALLLSGLAPAAILRDRGLPHGGGGLVSDLLVTLQFAILIGLTIAGAVVYQQRSFAMRAALHVNADNLVTVSARCPDAFRREVTKLPGVAGVSCSGAEFRDSHSFIFIPVGDKRVSTDIAFTLPGNFALYGIRSVAGTLEALPPDGEKTMAHVVINLSAVRAFGFSSPEAAIGQTVPVSPDQPVRATIVAVVPDFSMASVEEIIKPAIYVDMPVSYAGPGLVTIKLTGNDVPGTLAAIDRLWKATGQRGAIEREFVSDHIAGLYRSLARETWIFGLFSLIAALLACLGVAGMAISATERRTKEIGIRKAMGADSAQVLALLLGRVGQPVLWANLIAWPLAWWLMRGWLDGFAYRVTLHLWLFPLAGIIALLVALASAGLQAWGVARQRPVVALRHE